MSGNLWMEEGVQDQPRKEDTMRAAQEQGVSSGRNSLFEGSQGERVQAGWGK